MRIPEELRAYMVSLIMIFAVCSVALYEDSGLEVPQCKRISGTVIDKVYPIPDAPGPLHGLVVQVDSELQDINETLDGKYYIIVSNTTYEAYDVNYTISETICSAEEYDAFKSLVYALLQLDTITRAEGE